MFMVMAGVCACYKLKELQCSGSQYDNAREFKQTGSPQWRRF